MFIFSDMIIHGLCRFIYNLVAVLYNDILLFKNMKRRGAFWPSGVDFGLYYNNFALILQQSCAPGLFPRPGRQGALIFWYVASLDKGTHGFHGSKRHLASLSSLMGDSPSASSALPAAVYPPGKLGDPPGIPARFSQGRGRRLADASQGQ